jgi:hypothetical protein
MQALRPRIEEAYELLLACTALVLDQREERGVGVVERGADLVHSFPDVLAAPPGVVTAPVFGAYRWPD